MAHSWLQVREVSTGKTRWDLLRYVPLQGKKAKGMASSYQRELNAGRSIIGEAENQG